MVTLTLVLDFEDLRDPAMVRWMASQANRDIMLLEWYDCYCNYYFALPEANESVDREALNTVREYHATLKDPLEEFNEDVFEIGYSHFITGPQDTLEVCDAYRAHRGYFDYILNNDQMTLQASRLRCWRRFSKLLVVTSHLRNRYEDALDISGTLENQDDFSFEDFVICPEDYDLAGLELMMDRNNEFDKYQQEVDENRGDYEGEE
jgi:hypothetical protein